MSTSTSASSAFGSDLRTALVAMVRKRVPESEVEDIVQSTLADAIESPHAPTDSESLRRWIFGVAKNKVVDYHRRAGRETFEVPDVAEKPAPHTEADLLRWAEKHLPPGDENRTTLDWMLREGEGEKLEWIAETEKVPAPRVRQRVSRLRRHLKTHWQKEIALLATVGVLLTVWVLVLKKKAPEPIANEDVPRAAEIRKQAFEKCLAQDWTKCIDGLDAAKQLDPAGDSRPEVRQARENAKRAVVPSPESSSLAPTPSNRNLPPPPLPKTTRAVPTVDSTATPPTPKPFSSGDFDFKARPQKSIGPKSSSLGDVPPAPLTKGEPLGKAAKKPAPPRKQDVGPSSIDSMSDWDSSSNSNDIAPRKKKSAAPSK